MQVQESTITLRVRYAAVSCDGASKDELLLDCPPQWTTADLKAALADRLELPILQLKLFFKGHLLLDTDTLTDSHVGSGSQVMLIASDTEAISAVHEADSALALKVKAQRELLPYSVVSASQLSMAQRKKDAELAHIRRRIHRLEVLDLPEKDEALRILNKCATDRSIIAILEKHKWTVGVLKEMHPATPKIDGLNVNHGQEILLKLRRTDDVGFMGMHHIMGILLHELTHCDIGPHNAEFFALNAQLNKEFTALDWTKTWRTHGHALGGADISNNPEWDHTDAFVDPMDQHWTLATPSFQVLGTAYADRWRAVKDGNFDASAVAGAAAELRMQAAQLQKTFVPESCGSVDQNTNLWNVDHAMGTTGTVSSEVYLTDIHDDPDMLDDISGTKKRDQTVPATSLFSMPMPNVERVTEAADPDNLAQAPTYACSPVQAMVQECGAPNDAVEDDSKVRPSSPAAGELFCPICSTAFSLATYSERFVHNHVLQCLGPQRPLQQPKPLAPATLPSADPPAAQHLVCPFCSVELPSGASERFVANHVDQCLASSGDGSGEDAAPQKRKRDQTLDIDGSTSTESPTETTCVSAVDACASELQTAPCCPICSMTFEPDVSERFVSNHVESCLTNFGGS